MPLNRRRAGAALALLGLGGLAALAPLPAAAQAESKTRVYVVVIDGLNLEEVPLMPFVSSLAASGTYYTEARSVMVAETIPNHVSMVTGAYPDRTGIPANDFPVGEQVEGAEDLEELPSLLEADSVFTLVSQQCPDVTTAAVTSKDYLYAVMEHDRDGDGERDADINFANLDDPTFIPNPAGLTPDERTIAEALRVVQEDDPSFLFVNLGAVDRSGHADVTGAFPAPTGTRPVIRDVQRTNTDNYLRAFVETLELQGTWDDTVLLVTADHSMDWSLPDRVVTVSDNPEIADILDEFVVASNGGATLFSLKDRSSPDADALLKRLRDSVVATEGVDEALYREPNPLDGDDAHWVGAVHPDWHQTGERSGDLLYTVLDGWRTSEPEQFDNPIPGNHGMPSTLRIPFIVSGGVDVVQQRVDGSDDPGVRADDQAENVDVAPTAAWLLGLEPPAAGFDGRVLEEAFAERPAGVCAAAAGGGSPSPSAAPTAAAPEPAGPRLPATGPVVLVPLLGLVAGAAAVVVRRRSGTS